MDKPRLTRWHWRAMVAPEQRGLAATPLELRLEDLHIPANAEQYPYVEGHQLSLHWADPHYPLDAGYRHERSHFITEDFRRWEARYAFWSEQVTPSLLVEVSLAKPEARLGDDLNEDQVLRVSYRHDGHEWLVAPVTAISPGLSRIYAAQDGEFAR